MTSETGTGTRRALIVRGGWEGHQPVEATDFFVPFLEQNGFTVRIEESPAVYADAEVMAATDLIVQSMTMSSIEREQLDGLIGAVRAGTGLVGWHGGIADAFRSSSDYLQFIGGQFAAHPGVPDGERVLDGDGNFVDHAIEFTELGRKHPITEGIDDFRLTTEQYWVLSDDYNDVLATTTQAVRPGDPWSRPVTSPAVWTRIWGEGRIVVATPGHRVDVLEIAPVRQIIERGMLWATR